MLDFPRLRSLEVPITLLLGMNPHAATEIGDILPDTLEELCLVWDLLNPYTWVNELKLLKLVRNLLVDVKSLTPHLKRIFIRIYHVMDVDLWGEKRADVGAECARVGIEMDVVHYELSPGLWTSCSYPSMDIRGGSLKA